MDGLGERGRKEGRREGGREGRRREKRGIAIGREGGRDGERDREVGSSVVRYYQKYIDNSVNLDIPWWARYRYRTVPISINTAASI